MRLISGRTKIWPVMVLALLWGSAAGAQEGAETGAAQGPAVPAHITAAEACPCTFGPLIADTAIPIETGKFALQPSLALAFTGGSFSPSWRRVTAGGDFKTLQFPVKFTYGPLKNMEVFLAAQYLHNWASSVNEPGPRGERAADFGGLGDINLTLKYQLLEETGNRPTLTGLFAVNFPTGHHHPLNPGNLGTDDLGTGSYSFTLGLNLSKWVKPFIFYGNLGYTISTSSKVTVEDEELGPAVLHTHTRDLLTFRLAAEYPFGGKGPWVALLEFYSQWELGRVLGPKGNASPAALLGILPGLEYVYSDKLAFAAGVAIDLAGKKSDFNYTPILSMIYIF